MAEITFTANVGAEPELRHTKSGQPVLNFRCCDSKSRKTESGEWETVKEQWFNVSLFGMAGEALFDQITKGARVRVAGEFYMREYETQNGKGTSLDVEAIGVKVFPKRNGGGNFGGQQPQQQSQPAQQWGGNQQAAGDWGTPANGEPPF
jgi:single-strand DNA-binding protein